MALMPAYYSTTRSGRRKSQRKSARTIELEREIADLKRRVGYTGKGARHKNEIPSYKVESAIPMSNNVGVGIAPKAEPKVYSGERKLLGIATMHKSNMVPVFSQEDAEAIAKMRRG
jgi:hypothetical protein